MNTWVFWVALLALLTFVEIGLAALSPGFSADALGAFRIGGYGLAWALAWLAGDAYRRRRTSISTGRPPGERTGSSPSNTP